MKPILLVVDSDLELCDLYKTILDEQGYEVETTSNGLDHPAILAQPRRRSLRTGGAAARIAALQHRPVADRGRVK